MEARLQTLSVDPARFLGLTSQLQRSISVPSLLSLSSSPGCHQLLLDLILFKLLYFSWVHVLQGAFHLKFLGPREENKASSTDLLNVLGLYLCADPLFLQEKTKFLDDIALVTRVVVTLVGESACDPGLDPGS